MGEIFSGCSVYNVCELLRDGIISSTWSCYFTLFSVQFLWAASWWDYIQYIVILFHVVPCAMSVSCSVMGLYPVHSHVIWRCSVYNFCGLLCGGNISSTWSFYFTLFSVQFLWAAPWWDYIQYIVMLFDVVPCTISVSCSVMGIYPVHGHFISRCSVYNVCELLRDGIISSTWSCYFTLFRVQCLWAATWWIISST
jgi:hypothetical protein